jgi:hypothetical protein
MRPRSVTPHGAEQLRSLMEQLAEAPRRRDLKTNTLIEALC